MAKIEIEAVDSSEELIASNCVISTEFLSWYRDLHNPRLIKGEGFKLAIEICLDHYEQYKEAPIELFPDLISSLLESEEADIEEIEKLELFEKKIHYNSSLGNVEYFVNKAQEYLEKNYNEQFREKLDDTIDYQVVLDKYNPPQLDTCESCNPFLDEDAVREAAQTVNKEQRVKFPGALGKVLNKHFTDAGFVCFMGPAKRGKSWWLHETAKRALRCGNGVFYITVSDMTRNEVISRFGHMNSGKPVHKENIGTHKKPIVDCMHNQTNECEVPCDVMVRMSDKPDAMVQDYRQVSDYCVCGDHCDKFRGALWYEDVELEEVLDEDGMVNAWKKFQKRVKNTKLEIFAARAGEFKITDLQKWTDKNEKLKGWKPTVIVIDYMDLAEDEVNHMDDRGRLNKVFMKANAYAKDNDCLVVSASQTNADGFGAEIITEENYSGDKRKLDHITCGIGLNQSPDEKESMLMRLNVFISRGAMFNKMHCMKVVQDLKLGKVIVDSYF